MLETLYKKVEKLENFLDEIDLFDGLYRKYSISSILLLFFGFMIFLYLEEGFSLGWWDLFVMIFFSVCFTMGIIVIIFLPLGIFFVIYEKVFIPLCKSNSKNQNNIFR